MRFGQGGGGGKAPSVERRAGVASIEGALRPITTPLAAQAASGARVCLGLAAELVVATDPDVLGLDGTLLIEREEALLDLEVEGMGIGALRHV